MYVVIGITGQTGSATARRLLEAGQQVRAVVRDAERAAEWRTRGVDLIEGDVGSPETLARALTGASGAYLIVPPNVTHPNPIDHYRYAAESFREAARSAGLPRLVFLSSEGAHLAHGTGPIIGSHHAESILREVAPRVTFLRATYFQENWKSLLGVAASKGILPSMLQPLEVPRSQVAAADIGRAAADLLLEADPPGLVELGGPEQSAADAARAIARVLGREVMPVALPRAAWAEAITDAGAGQLFADLICEMYDGINSGHVRFSGEGEARWGRASLPETVALWRH